MKNTYTLGTLGNVDIKLNVGIVENEYYNTYNFELVGTKVETFERGDYKLAEIVEDYVQMHWDTYDKWEYCNNADIRPSELLDTYIENAENYEIEQILIEKYEYANKVEFNSYADGFLVHHNGVQVEISDLLKMNSNLSTNEILDVISTCNVLNGFVVMHDTLENTENENKISRFIKTLINELEQYED